MKKLLPFVLAVALLAVACSGGGDAVATVNGIDILESEVLGFRTATDAATTDLAVFRDDLALIIIREAVAGQLEADYGIAITEQMVDEELEVQFEPFLEQLRTDARTELGDEAGDAEIAAYVEDHLGEIAAQVFGDPEATGGLLRHVVFVRLITMLGPDAVLGDAVVYQEAADSINQVCASHMLLASEEDAQAAFGRLSAGEDFAALATELSNDPGSAELGGELGCASPTGYVPEFASATQVAQIGVPFGPFETTYGWHILLVSERKSPTLEEFQAAPLEHLPPADAEQIWSNWVNFAISEADISVISRIGEWSASGQTIDPPGA